MERTTKAKTETEAFKNIEKLILQIEDEKPFPQGDKTKYRELAVKQIKTPQRAPRHVTAKSRNLEEWLFDLRKCESGGNYRRNSGNGYYGAYQFLISTWNRISLKVGRKDLYGLRPDIASPSDQDFMIIQNTNLSKGGLRTQNPGCYTKMGLSIKPPR